MPKTKLLNQDIREKDLIDIKEAPRILGRGYSRKSIDRRIKSGEFIEGIHWINDASINSKYRIIKMNVDAIRQLRATPSHQR